MVCLGLEPQAAGCKAQTNPLNYGGTPIRNVVCVKLLALRRRLRKRQTMSNICCNVVASL